MKRESLTVLDAVGRPVASLVKLISGVAKNYRVEVNKIVHSGKKRAAQTAALFAEVLRLKEGIVELSGLGPTDDVGALGPIKRKNVLKTRFQKSPEST